MAGWVSLMGKAVIEEALGEGLYRVRVDYGSTYRDLKIEAIDKALAELEPVLAEHQARLTSAEVIRANAAAQIDHMIGIYRQAVAEGVPADEMDPIRQALEDLATAHAEATKQVQIARLSVTDITTLIAETLQQKHALEGLRLEEVFPAWCTDYTEDAQPGTEVGTMEVPGEPQQIIIVPGCQPWSPSHGELRKKELMEAHQAYFNVAILPGWQRFWPTYRIGTVTAVHANDTVDVELEGTSTAQNLDIGPPSPTGTAPGVVISNVPVDYMSSGNTVFEVNDRVVVLLQNFDWSQPVVVGFEKEPRPVVGLLCHPAGAAKHRVFPSGKPGETRWRGVAANPGSLDVHYGRRGWTDGKKSVSWTNNRFSRFHRVFFRGMEANIVSMFPSLYYYAASNDYVMPWIMGAVAHGDHVVVVAYTYQPTRAGELSEQLDTALSLRRVDVLSFRLNRDFGAVWLDLKIEHSIVLPVMGYLSRTQGNDPNVAAYLYGRCQGYSQSPLGRTMMFFYDSAVYRFDVSVTSEELTVTMETLPHPSVGENGGISTRKQVVDSPGHGWFGGSVDFWPSLWKYREITQQVKLSGSWYVGGDWDVVGDTESWRPLIYSINLDRQYQDVAEYQTATLDRWLWDGGAKEYVYVPAVNTRVHYTSAQEVSGTISARYSGALDIDLIQWDLSARDDRTATYNITPGVPGSGPTLNGTTEDWTYDRTEAGVGNFVHPFLDAQRGSYAVNEYFFQRHPPIFTTLGDMTVVSGGETVGSSDNSDSKSLTSPLSFSAPPTWGFVSVQTPLDEEFEVDPIDPFYYHTAFGFDSPQGSDIGSIRSNTFFSLTLGNGDVINYMTSNPELANVFPEGSDIDLTANFAPIVPF